MDVHPIRHFSSHCSRSNHTLLLNELLNPLPIFGWQRYTLFSPELELRLTATSAPRLRAGRYAAPYTIAKLDKVRARGATNLNRCLITLYDSGA